MNKNLSTKTVVITFLLLPIALIAIGFGFDRWGHLLQKSPSETIVGKYVAEPRDGQASGKTVELQPDGRFIFWEREDGGLGVPGSYEAVGREITLTYEGGPAKGLVAKAEIIDSSAGQGQIPSMQDSLADMSGGHRKVLVSNDDVMGRSVGYLKEDANPQGVQTFP